MLQIVLRRFSISIPLILVVSFVVFLLVDIAPGDPAARLAGENPTPQRLAEIRHELGLDDPLIERYVGWLSGAVHGSFGDSLSTTQTVNELLSEKAPVTASLILVTAILAVVLGISLGVVAATARPGGLIDRVVTIVASLGIAIPSFWLGLLLVVHLAIANHWFPSIGYKPLSDGFGSWLAHLILPALSLAALSAAELALQMKEALRDALGRDYILTATAKGIRPTKVVLKHGVKNAAIPVVTVLGFRLAEMIGGAVIVEEVFSLHGLGSLLVNSTLGGDIPVILALTVVIAVAVAVANLAVDISYGYFDPRTRT